MVKGGVMWDEGEGAIHEKNALISRDTAPLRVPFS